VPLDLSSFHCQKDMQRNRRTKVCDISINRNIKLTPGFSVQFDRVHFSDTQSTLQLDVNHYLSMPSLFPVLLLPQNVSASTEHTQEVYILRGYFN
jgi:hypothetical protein